LTRRALISLTAVALCSASAAARAQTTDTLSLDRRLYLVKEMDAHVRQHFAHWAGLAGRSYDSMVTVFRDSASASAARRDFDRAAQAFTAGLANGHSRFSDEWLLREDGATLWLRLKPTADGWTVMSSEYPGLVRGDVVRTIDGQSFDTFYQARRRLVPESGERSRQYALAFAAHLFPRSFVLGLANGDTVRVTRDAASDSTVRARRTTLLQTPWRWIEPGRVGYVQVRQFSPASHEDAALSIIRREFLESPALIVDVRGNGGGNTPGRLIRLLMADSSWRTMPVDTSTIPGDRGVIGRAIPMRGDAKGYRGRLVILADHACGSACEDFVGPFRDNGRALIVGDTTWGSTGQPRFIDLGDGMRFQVSARRYRMADGSPYEGVGVPPHVVVPARAAALRAGRDEALEQAVALLREPDEGARELVVVLHGMGRTSRSMRPMVDALRVAGFDVLNIGYSSVCCSISQLGDSVRREIESRRLPNHRTVHFVGHSLGNIIARWIVSQNNAPSGVSRLVMLAPPNQGALMATRFAPFAGWLLKPLHELRNDTSATVRKIPTPRGVEIGVIAGRDDGKVRIEETHVAGERAHIVVKGNHTFIMRDAHVQALTVEFLRSGRFSSTEASVRLRALVAVGPRI
jgi:carboxyl-terminal processing protease